MIEVGRLCVKIAGRDAGKKCVVVEVLDNNFVAVDGETRRRKCNIIHLEPLDTVVKIKTKASHEDVAKALNELGINARETKPKQAVKKPLKARKSVAEPEKEIKKPAKKK